MAGTAPIHYKLADKLIELMQKGTHRRGSQERMDNRGNYEQIISHDPSFVLPQEIAIVDISIYDGLKPNALKLLIRIQQELLVNNPLWECKNKNLSEVRAGLAQLKEKDIIESIQGTDIYIINPEKIRRGKPLTILATLYMHCKQKWEKDKRWRPNTADIKRLLPPKSLTILNPQ